ncbi:hypothetical protein ACIQYG_11670, partial [Peribacillus sp. NPDC096622]
TGVEIDVPGFTHPNKHCRKKVLPIFQNKLDWNGRCETPAGKARQGETPQAQSDEETPRPPAESECLEWKSTFEVVLQTLIKTADKLDFHRVYLLSHPFKLKG